MAQLNGGDKFKFKSTVTDAELRQFGLMPPARDYGLVFEVYNVNQYRPPDMLYALYNNLLYDELNDYIFVGEGIEEFIEIV